MTFSKIKEISRPHALVLTIDRFLPRFLRAVFRKLSATLALFSFILSFASIDVLPLDFSFADALFFLFVFFYLIFASIEFFYHSMKGEGIYSRVVERNLKENRRIDFALSEILYHTSEIDITRGIFESKTGKRVLERSGVEKDEWQGFVDGARTPIISGSVNTENEQSDLVSYLSAVYELDKVFAQFLNTHNVGKKEFLGAALMEAESIERERREERFWGREKLGSIPSIGKSWSYGISFELGKYGRSFGNTIDLSLINLENGYREHEVSILEGILERSEEANAVIVSNSEDVSRDIVARLLRKIRLGIALPNIEHKEIIELDWSALLATFKNKADIESEILKLLTQASNAGNIILYIRDLPSFLVSAKQSGVNVASLLSPYLNSSSLNIVAHSTSADFHFFLETSAELSEKFERVLPVEVHEDSSLPVIIEKVRSIEDGKKILVSFGAIKQIVLSAVRHITTGEMPEKALDLLDEVLSTKLVKGQILKEEDVVAYVSEKTGIKIGKVGEEEMEKINRLESLLGERVVGQKFAVDTVSSAVRRARSGLGNPNRPIGSFLFFGPTGVGKTETAKTLALVYFGSEDKMVRIDMSEYSGFDALSRLIGNFSDGKPGILSSKVKDNPYGVLLLDEFEKASREVHDLFLQILDEGFFSDASGNKVNCRNLIIIATSNAGSDLIWKAESEGKNLAEEKDEIINKIVEQKIFKPELLNRFDGLVVFEPLGNENLATIARLELEKLKEQLVSKEIELVITDELVRYLVEKGADPKFGARSINRAVKTIVEDAVAKKIISGEVKSGGKIEVKVEEL